MSVPIVRCQCYYDKEGIHVVYSQYLLQMGHALLNLRLMYET